MLDITLTSTHNPQPNLKDWGIGESDSDDDHVFNSNENGEGTARQDEGNEREDPDNAWFIHKSTKSRRKIDMALARANRELLNAKTADERAAAEEQLNKARFSHTGAELGAARSCFYSFYF